MFAPSWRVLTNFNIDMYKLESSQKMKAECSQLTSGSSKLHKSI